MPNLKLLITGGDSQSSLLPASKPTRGGQDASQWDWWGTGPCSHEWHWVTQQTWESRTQKHDRGQGSASVRGQGWPGSQTHQTCASQGWALLLEVTTKVTLTTHLAAGKYLKVHMWPFSDTQERAHYDFNNLILSFALLFSKISSFKTVVHRFQRGMHASYFEQW